MSKCRFSLLILLGRPPPVHDHRRLVPARPPSHPRNPRSTLARQGCPQRLVGFRALTNVSGDVGLDSMCGGRTGAREGERRLGVQAITLQLRHAVPTEVEKRPKPPQCDPKATTKPYTWEYIATPKPLQSHSKATPKPPQSHPGAKVECRMQNAERPGKAGKSPWTGTPGVDAFDQPAVEQGKVLAKKYLMS